jgi:uncharacterized protein YodC (DUF2158 family)
MQVGTVVQLKSGGPPMDVNWEIGVTLPQLNSDILMQTTGYGLGDNACSWLIKSQKKEKVFPVEALSIIPINLAPPNGQTLRMGNVVKLNSNQQQMTINWVIGSNARPVVLINIDETLMLKGFRDGDIVCLWFDENSVLHEESFSATSVTKIYE